MDERKRELWLATWVRTCEPMLREFPDLVEPTAELTGYHWLTDHDVERRIFKKFRPMRIPATTQNPLKNRCRSEHNSAPAKSREFK
ncbi:hypothetical protein CLV88_103117 [Shimia abyssi]|uniref:Uncharacterized protein n=1 Tax=Shimia abyssi TaxID=1662395 RepID=A0A2P8FFJ1_9RHOB|nr:hypothetical protein CLV88_103117 [Shimia abyssi]